MLLKRVLITFMGILALLFSVSIYSKGDQVMADPTYKRIDIVGTSSKGTDDAIQNGIAKATETIHDVDWFEVIEIRGRIENVEKFVQGVASDQRKFGDTHVD